MNAPSASEFARRLADVLEARSIPYGIGGALALGVWGFPRATRDLIDVERLVASMGQTFDREHVTRALLDIVGPDDGRLPR